MEDAVSRRPNVVPFRQREQLEPLLADIEAYAAAPALGDRDILLIHAAGQLWRVREDLTREPVKMQAVLRTLRVLRDASGAGKCSAEEEIMKHLIMVACECVGWLQRGRVTREGFRAVGHQGLKPKLQPLGAVLQILVEFARECFVYSRPRDNFGGKRRSLAFEILGMAGGILDLPDVVELARQTVKKSRADALGARSPSWSSISKPAASNPTEIRRPHCSPTRSAPDIAVWPSPR